jgi:hypothetical protein
LTNFAAGEGERNGLMRLYREPQVEFSSVESTSQEATIVGFSDSIAENN